MNEFVFEILNIVFSNKSCDSTVFLVARLIFLYRQKCIDSISPVLEENIQLIRLHDTV